MTPARPEVAAMLEASLLAVQAGDWRTGAERALEALHADDHNGHGWWLLAICREKAGELRDAFLCFQSAFALLPEHGEITRDIGRLAARLGETEAALQLFARHLADHPGQPEVVNNLACALREQGRFAEATDVLRAALSVRADAAPLWNTLGTLMIEQGDTAKAQAFYREALRLQPDLAEARYNYSSALLAAGDAANALVEIDRALAAAPSAGDAATMRLARAGVLLALGDLKAGWEAYGARLSPDYPETTHFQVARPLWSAGKDVLGKSLLVVGEQGLGDEILFANVLPSLIDALGPDGRLTLAVEPRLVYLFARAFPAARVGAHETSRLDGRVVRTLPFLTDPGGIDLWTPMASLLQSWRGSVRAFPSRHGYLKADPDRVVFWRARLAELGPGPKVGVLTGSLQQYTSRLRWVSAFECWEPVLRTPGVRFVDLQYGDAAAVRGKARAAGLELWTPPGLDLTRDLDEVAALSCALDLVISPPNATSNLAAACGAAVWLVTAPGVWPQLGTPVYPWYPQAEVFTAGALDDWGPVMARIAQALAEAFDEPASRPQ